MITRWRPALPPLAAFLAALAAPALLGAGWEASLRAGALVCLLHGVAAMALPGAAQPAPATRLIAAAGFAFLAAAAGVPLLPAAPRGIPLACLLPGGMLLAAAAARAVADGRRTAAEVEWLRARLARREGDVQAQAERIRRLDLLDPATGLLNRRGFSLALESALGECAGEERPLALLLVGLEEPLATNPATTEGRRARLLGRAVQQAVRGSDQAGRWGASVLALLLPRCEDPRPAVDRLRRGLAGAGVDGEAVRVAGIHVGPRGPWPDGDTLLAAARAALEAARRGPAGAEPPVWPVDWGLASLENARRRPAGSAC